MALAGAAPAEVSSEWASLQGLFSFFGSLNGSGPADLSVYKAHLNFVCFFFLISVAGNDYFHAYGVLSLF